MPAISSQFDSIGPDFDQTAPNKAKLYILKMRTIDWPTEKPLQWNSSLRRNNRFRIVLNNASGQKLKALL